MNILDSRLPEFYPGLASDIGRVVAEGHRRSAMLKVDDGERLRVIVKPTRGVAKSCTIVIVPLEDD